MWSLAYYINNGYQIGPWKHSLVTLNQMLNCLFCVLTDMAELQTMSNQLPDLPDQVCMSVEDTLKALGAVTADDLKYITVGDLLPVSKPIQARRLAMAWAQNSKCKAFPPQHSTLIGYDVVLWFSFKINCLTLLWTFLSSQINCYKQ